MATFLPVLIVAAILVLVLTFFVRRSRPAPGETPEPGLSPTIHRIRANVRAILSKQYPAATVYSHGESAQDPRLLTVTINVPTDRQRDSIRLDPLLRDRFRQALIDADYPATALGKVVFNIESQQTIDRN